MRSRARRFIILTFQKIPGSEKSLLELRQIRSGIFLKVEGQNCYCYYYFFFFEWQLPVRIRSDRRISSLAILEARRSASPLAATLILNSLLIRLINNYRYVYTRRTLCLTVVSLINFSTESHLISRKLVSHAIMRINICYKYARAVLIYVDIIFPFRIRLIYN